MTQCENALNARTPRKRVIIVGAGFGGLAAAKKLGRSPQLDVMVIDQKNYHLFQPLLYQVAMAALSPADIAGPIRAILRKYESVQVIMGKAERVDVDSKVVHTDCGVFTFDYLILACGSTHSYFGHEDWEEDAPGLKTVEQATEIRRRVLLAFELAEREPSLEKQKICLTFVIVGGGPTGVEMAGAIAEIGNRTLIHDFDHIDLTHTKVILVEGAQRILPTFPEDLSARAQRDLEKLGITVRTGQLVTDVTSSGVAIGDEFIPCCTVLWAAGVKPSPINRQLGHELDKSGRVYVASDLSLPRHPDVFVIGDQAHARDESGRPLPGLAPVAMQQGRFVAKVILNLLQGKARTSFHYRDKGQLATIGRKSAVASIGKRRLTGTIAWLAWLFIHIYYLIGFRNKIAVLISWIWSYVTFNRTARLIVNSGWRNEAWERQQMTIDAERRRHVS